MITIHTHEGPVALDPSGASVSLSGETLKIEHVTALDTPVDGYTCALRCKRENDSETRVLRVDVGTALAVLARRLKHAIASGVEADQTDAIDLTTRFTERLAEITTPDLRRLGGLLQGEPRRRDGEVQTEDETACGAAILGRVLPRLPLAPAPR
jgi:hypothetical protein